MLAALKSREVDNDYGIHWMSRTLLELSSLKGTYVTANMSEARKRSVDNLQRLYAVVISLAVTEAVRRTVFGSQSTDPPELSAISANQWLILTSFLLTVIPFYHGANRYLDATYVTKERSAS